MVSSGHESSHCLLSCCGCRVYTFKLATITCEHATQQTKHLCDLGTLSVLATATTCAMYTLCCNKKDANLCHNKVWPGTNALILSLPADQPCAGCPDLQQQHVYL